MRDTIMAEAIRRWRAAAHEGGGYGPHEIEYVGPDEAYITECAGDPPVRARRILTAQGDDQVDVLAIGLRGTPEYREIAIGDGEWAVDITEPGGEGVRDAIMCDVCGCYGLLTVATTTRTIRALGTRVDWMGEVEHPVCAECAAVSDDRAAAERGGGEIDAERSAGA